ncbi:hypothetical protein ACRQ5Q_18370 [Bradyrhizobium sp. PMVTL-01]|uniref:hypothetical protein n=1 Tax=Bradyrhizobium sp. PMVTL-01 TaxID=3434999 RepID=UPI003F70B31D
MELMRYGQSYKIQSRNEFNKVDSPDPALRVDFLNFGRGYERKSAFGVNIRWQDVESAIEKFSEMGHPKAIELRNAIDLARAAQEVGWQASNTSPSN